MWLHFLISVSASISDSLFCPEACNSTSLLNLISPYISLLSWLIGSGLLLWTHNHLQLLSNWAWYQYEAYPTRMWNILWVRFWELIWVRKGRFERIFGAGKMFLKFKWSVVINPFKYIRFVEMANFFWGEVRIWWILFICYEDALLFSVKSREIWQDNLKVSWDRILTVRSRAGRTLFCTYVNQSLLIIELCLQLFFLSFDKTV